MYEDNSLKAKGYIDEIHAMTYDEAVAITGSTDGTNGLRNTKACYWLATTVHEKLIYFLSKNGSIGATYSVWDSNANKIVDSNIQCWGVRPVVQMNEGVYIASGDGTGASPYVLGKD